jgi:uncharacterized protein (TIGR04562 family)
MMMTLSSITSLEASRLDSPSPLASLPLCEDLATMSSSLTPDSPSLSAPPIANEAFCKGQPLDKVLQTSSNPGVETETADDLRQQDWSTLHALLEGDSFIDSRHFRLDSLEAARRFIKHYGFDVEAPLDSIELDQHYHEAISFIQNHLLEGYETDPTKTLSIPSRFRKSFPIPNLLCLAAGHETQADGTLAPVKDPVHQRWACAILKVMHTILHIEHSTLWPYLPLASQQIISQYRQILDHDPQHGDALLCRPDRSQPPLQLHGVHLKETKSRDSLLLKLLSKKTYLAETTDDLVGIRFITHSPLDALKVLHILLEHQLLMLPNINPNRSRNSLLHLQRIEERFTQVLEHHPHCTLDDLFHWMEEEALLTDSDGFQQHNPNSSKAYRSVHITGRYLLRVPLLGSSRNAKVFFPYEIQCLDKMNYRQSLLGEAAHKAYKNRQCERARLRVLGPLLTQTMPQLP